MPRLSSHTAAPKIDYDALTGVVARIVPDRGFCFLRCDQDGQDYFCHASSLSGCAITELQRGEKVRFAGTETDKGWRASGVSLI